ncbi:MAG: helix-turn-helix domain-containing protein [Eggerthellaceae bacterium]|nr:helix-turn-helix domain-containing protein [Eggerthellaceae bacterium]
MITTSEAAQRLGVSQRRIIALIQSGRLCARKAGGIWLVDEASVKQRLATAQH